MLIFVHVFFPHIPIASVSAEGVRAVFHTRILWISIGQAGSTLQVLDRIATALNQITISSTSSSASSHTTASSVSCHSVREYKDYFSTAIDATIPVLVILDDVWTKDLFKNVG